jgi:hypothetical protein
VPIFDTGVAFLSDRVLAVSNGYGNIRHYDTRASIKAISTAAITEKDMMLTHIV